MKIFAKYLILLPNSRKEAQKILCSGPTFVGHLNSFVEVQVILVIIKRDAPFYPQEPLKLTIIGIFDRSLMGKFKFKFQLKF